MFISVQLHAGSLGKVKGGRLGLGVGKGKGGGMEGFGKYCLELGRCA